MRKTRTLPTVTKGTKVVRKPATTEVQGRQLLLNPDIVLLLLPYLTGKDLGKFSLVCKYYRNQVIREETWKAMAGIRGKVPSTVFMDEQNRRRLPNPYIRYFVLSLEVGKVYIKGAENYVTSHSLMKCLAETSPDSVLIEMHNDKPQLVCYGIYKSDRLELLDTLKIDPKLEMYWGSALDALVANDDPVKVEEFLKFPIDFQPPLDPLTSAFHSCDEVWYTVMNFYTREHKPKFCCDVMRMAFVAGRLDRADDLLKAAGGVIDNKTHVHLMGSLKTDKQFKFYCNLLTSPEDYTRLLYFLIENDCRNKEWLEAVEVSIGYVPIDECLAIASQKDNVDYYKYLIRRGSIKMSDIVIDLNAIKHKRKSLVFFTMNRHPDMPDVIISNLANYTDAEIKNFLLPYVLDKTKKTIDHEKLKKFCTTFPEAKFYLLKK